MGRGKREDITIVRGEVDWFFDLGVGFDAIEIAFDCWGFVQFPAIFQMEGRGQVVA